MVSDDKPFIRERWKPPVDPREVRFVAKLAVEPLTLPRPAPHTPVEARRAKAEHLCLWLGCSRALCRRARHCLGTHALCVFEQADVRAPLIG